MIMNESKCTQESILLLENALLGEFEHIIDELKKICVKPEYEEYVESFVIVENTVEAFKFMNEAIELFDQTGDFFEARMYIKVFKVNYNEFDERFKGKYKEELDKVVLEIFNFMQLQIINPKLELTYGLASGNYGRMVIRPISVEVFAESVSTEDIL